MLGTDDVAVSAGRGRWSGSDDRSGRRVTPSVFSQAAIFVVALLVFALLPTQNFNYADDSLSWAYQLTQSGNLINSQHLYFNAMRWLYQLLHDAGLTIRPARRPLRRRNATQQATRRGL